MNDQLLRALDEADAGNWEQAHRIVQDIEHPHAYWIHANLHRQEGDDGNAMYWYRRAGKPFVKATFAEERRQIREEIG